MSIQHLGGGTLSTKINRNMKSMPHWVNEQNDRIGPKPPAPPPLTQEPIYKAPALPPKVKNQPEPDYEVIEFSGQQYSNEPMKATSTMRPKTPDSKLKCTLCGSNNPWVRCDECSQQIFCASCDDMFHKHPKRKNHVRKAIEQTRPPVPPKVLPGQPGPTPPVAPPRRSKRGFPTPLLSRKDQGNANHVPIPPSPTPSQKNADWHNSLKRGLNLFNRPLPDTPKTPTPSEGNSTPRSVTPKSAFDNIQRPPSVTLEKIKSKASATLDRMALLQQRYRQQKEERDRNRSGSITDQQNQLQQQQRLMGANRNGGLGNKSTSVFNLNQINRRPLEQSNNWAANPVQQAQSMAQLNCAQCNQNSNWNLHAQHMQPHHHHHQHDEWSINQFNSQHNRSNLSLNVGGGYMMQQQPGVMYPPPAFMNQRNMMGNMYPYPYVNGMPTMNPGLMSMPPAARSRATSRAASHAPSPAMSRKSITLRRKHRSYADDELTDDEDSDQDDRRSIISNRSAMAAQTRTRQRRISSASQAYFDEDSETNNVRNLRARARDQRRGSTAKSVQSDWTPGRRASTNNSMSNEPASFAPLKPSRIYSDLDSESSGTRALVQAKIQQKMDDEAKKKRHTKKTSDSESVKEKPIKKSTEVQVGSVRRTTKDESKVVQEAQEIDKKQTFIQTESTAKLESDVEDEEVEEEQVEDINEEEVEDETRNKVEVTEDFENEVAVRDESPPLGPPPTTPDHEWECEFCTFVNEPKIKICVICCKTPSKPPVKPKFIPPVAVKQNSAATTATETEKIKQKTANKPTSSLEKTMIPKPSSSSMKAKITSSENESDNSIAKKKESLEDIWAALDENIQSTAVEVKRNAETKHKNKVSTACGASPVRETSVLSNTKGSAKEMGTSSPPQSISTQTYDVLPNHKSEPYFDELKSRETSTKPYAVEEKTQAQAQVPSPFSSYSRQSSQYPRDPETELYILLKEAELSKFTPEELHAALKYCGPDMHPVQWLRENWTKLIQTVQSLATKYGQERIENTIGTISQVEARDALRMHGGNIWQAVSECIEQRQRKFREISSKGNFSREDIVTALTAHQGNIEVALMDLSRTQLKPFLMRIWGSPEGVENESSANFYSANENISSDLKLKPTFSNAAMETLNTQLEAVIKLENALPELPAEVILNNNQSHNIALATVHHNLENNLTELPLEVVSNKSNEQNTSVNNLENSLTDLKTEASANKLDNNLENVASGITSNESSLTEIPIPSPHKQTEEVAASVDAAKSTSPQSMLTSLASNDKEEPHSSTIIVENIQTEEPKTISTNVEVEQPSTSTKKVKVAEVSTTNNKRIASKIPKPKENKQGAIKKVPTRSKSFSGPPTPIVFSSVKTLQQEFLSKQTKQGTLPPTKNPPPAVRKKSISDAISKFTKQTTSTNFNGPSTSNLFRSRTQPRIPKKKYHETCFSDDDYQTTSSEEEATEPLEERKRKLSVPVFRRYPSIKIDEPEIVNPEEFARKLVDDNLLPTISEAQIAATLVNMKFQQDVAIWAAKECSDLEHAIALLQQECELCMGIYPMNEIVSMLKCTHKCCKQCAKTYFTVQITDRSINDCNCPFCKMPELHHQNEHEDENLEYFSNLDIFLKNILETEVHELFQRKLRDRTLLMDPNFKWCMQCSSGFFARPKQKRLICPDCGSVTCSQCRKTWEKQHEGISCEKYLEWKAANDPEISVHTVQEHLAHNGIDCPKCKFRYSLARGGCMHFTCTQCKFEFCYGCAKPFMMGAKCTISSYCAKLGLHAHHPRNCLFYLRDKIPLQLQFLLKENGVSFDIENTEFGGAAAAAATTSEGQKLYCPIPLQKETPTGMVDTVCNGDVPDNHAGLCRTHYVEYLTAKVAKARIDPLPIFDLTDCVQELRRRGIPLPERGPWDTDEIYKGMCSEVIKKNIPLEAD